MASNMNVTMPKAALAAWLAFAGNHFETTDVVIKSRLNKENAADERQEITTGMLNADESIHLLAQKITASDSVLTSSPSTCCKEEMASCPLCTRALVIIKEEQSKEIAHDHHLDSQGMVLSKVPESSHDSKSAYGLVVTFSKAAAQGMRVTLNHCQHVGTPAEEIGWARWLQEAVRQLCNEEPFEETTMGDYTSQKDLFQIWQWNNTVPETVYACVHDIITDVARTQPASPAVCAWDGELTYREFDALSDKLAAKLVDLGVGPGTIVPLCFEKSMWTPVAMLGVMKSGAASVAMDSSHAKGRLRTVVHQAHSHSSRRVILSSVANEDLADGLSSPVDPKTTVLIPEILLRENCGDRESLQATAVSPHDALCVVFTSGSTGTPKGIVITHANFSSAIAHHKAPLCFNSTCRVFDFASYGFDLAWANALHTLAAGGCMCIPSDEQRRGDIVTAIQVLRANYLDLTPIVARQISWADVPSVRTIVFGGEKLAALDIRGWTQCSNIRNQYGPAECTVTSTVLPIAPGDDAEPGIGRGCGTVTWIVRMDGSGLASIGEMGELWLEGPLVGKEYLGSPAKTAAAFLEDPPWLLQGGPGTFGRHGRLYRTGDHVRYNMDGSIQFLGRKDDQVKIRGQRVELGDVEHHLRQCLATRLDLAIVADVAQPVGSVSPMLVAFLAIGELAGGASRMKEGSAALTTMTEALQVALAKNLPAHMIPSAYIPIAEIPLTDTGKTDRRWLRDLVSAMTIEQVANLNLVRSRDTCPRAPSTEAERQLQQLWSAALCMDADNISASETFSRIGGDSIAAMRLVAAARDRGLKLAITDVFQHPRLSDMAAKLGTEGAVIHETVPFSLTNVGLDRVKPVLRRHYPEGVLIKDVFPVTDFQAFCIKYAVATPLGRTQQYFVDLPPTVNSDQLLDICNQLWWHVDILRAIFVQIDGEYLQVIPQNIPLDISVHTVESVVRASEQWFASDTSMLELGKCDFRMAMFQCPSGQKGLAMRLCHAQYDGMMLALIGTCMEALLNGTTPPSLFSFSVYMQNIKDQRLHSAPYWKRLLRGCDFTRLSFDAPSGSSMLNEHTIRFNAPQRHFTAANTFYAIATMAISKLTGSSDVTVGILVSGRATLPHQLDIAGPCANFIPLRVQFDGHEGLEKVVGCIHDQRTASLKHEASQMSDVAKVSTTCMPGEQFGIILQFQNIQDFPSFHSHKGRVEFRMVDRPMVYIDPTIYVYTKPQGNEWVVSFVSSPKFYERRTVQRLAEAVIQVARENEAT